MNTIQLFTRRNYILLSGLLLCVMMYMSFDWGPSNDERYNVPYAERCLDFYLTMGSNDSVLMELPDIDPAMKHYNVSTELPAHLLHRIFDWDLYNLRHLFATLFSFLYIFFGGLIAKRITGRWSAAFLAMLFLVLTPRIFGESFNNPKDSPYVGTTIFSLWTFMVFLDALPRPNWKTAGLLMAGVAASLLVRISGLMTDFLFVVFILLEYYFLKKKSIEFDFKNVFIKVFVAMSGGYFLGILFWPAILLNPIFQPFESLTFLRNLPVSVRNLFEGKYLPSSEIPWYYLPKYFAISNPEIIVGGIILGFLLIFKLLKAYPSRRIIFMLTFSLFPLYLIIYSKTGLLTGWRHGYFIYIPLVIFSAIAYHYILNHLLSKDLYKKIGYSVIIITLIPTVLFMVRNYPLFYVYFNPMSGGIKNALGRYELDYYCHSLKPATDYLIANEKNISDKVIASNNTFQIEALMNSANIPPKIAYVRYRERYDSEWDIGVFSHSFIDAKYLKQKRFPPKGTIKTIDIDGVPICAIIKRQDKNDVLGKNAMSANNLPLAIEYLKKAVAYDEYNELALSNLGMAYLYSNNPGAAVQPLEQAIDISPESVTANYGLGMAYFYTNQIEKAQSVFEGVLTLNQGYAPTYQMLSQIFKLKGDNHNADRFMQIYNSLTGQ